MGACVCVCVLFGGNKKVYTIFGACEIFLIQLIFFLIFILESRISRVCILLYVWDYYVCVGVQRDILYNGEENIQI